MRNVDSAMQISEVSRPYMRNSYVV